MRKQQTVNILKHILIALIVTTYGPQLWASSSHSDNGHHPQTVHRNSHCKQSPASNSTPNQMKATIHILTQMIERNVRAAKQHQHQARSCQEDSSCAKRHCYYAIAAFVATGYIASRDDDTYSQDVSDLSALVCLGSLTYAAAANLICCISARSKKKFKEFAEPFKQAHTLLENISSEMQSRGDHDPNILELYDTIVRRHTNKLQAQLSPETWNRLAGYIQGQVTDGRRQIEREFCTLGQRSLQGQ